MHHGAWEQAAVHAIGVRTSASTEEQDTAEELDVWNALATALFRCPGFFRQPYHVIQVHLEEGVRFDVAFWNSVFAVVLLRRGRQARTTL